MNDVQVIDRDWHEMEVALELARKNRTEVHLCRHTNGSYGNFLLGMPANPDWHLVGVATPPSDEPHSIGYFTFSNGSTAGSKVGL